MPVTYHWYQDRDDVVYIKIVHPWTVDEISNCEREIRNIIAKRKIMLDAIYDVSKHGRVASNTLSYFVRSRKKGMSSQYEGVAIVYGASPYAKALADMLIRLTRTQSIRFAQTLDEVDNILADIRAQRDAPT